MAVWQKLTGRQKEKQRDFGSLWPGADKTKNRSNPPPAYSPDSRWPGPPCITKQRDRDTMTQSARQKERMTDRHTERPTEKWEMQRFSDTEVCLLLFFNVSFFHFLHSFLCLPSSMSCDLWEVSLVSLGQSWGSCSLLIANSINMMRCDGEVQRQRWTKKSSNNGNESQTQNMTHISTMTLKQQW